MTPRRGSGRAPSKPWPTTARAVPQSAAERPPPLHSRGWRDVSDVVRHRTERQSKVLGEGGGGEEPRPNSQQGNIPSRGDPQPRSREMLSTRNRRRRPRTARSRRGNKQRVPQTVRTVPQREPTGEPCQHRRSLAEGVACGPQPRGAGALKGGCPREDLLPMENDRGLKPLVQENRSQRPP